MLRHDDVAIVRKAFNNLLEIVRLRPGHMSDYYEAMMAVLTNSSNQLMQHHPELITEFVILSMPRAGDILTQLFYNEQPAAPTIGRTIQLLSLLPSY